jgi:DNA-binding SARP family transcriptional activator
MSISALRKVLEPNLDSREPSRYLKLVDDRYLLEWDMIGSFDVRAFEAGVREGDRLRETEPLAAVAAYAAAVAACRGPLLTDALFQGAFEAERNQLRHQAVGTLMWLADFHQGRGDFTNAEAALLRATELAPTEEDVYLALMRFYQARGRAERIRQVYWDCRKALKAHLGLTPSEDFEAGHKAIAAGGVKA